MDANRLFQGIEEVVHENRQAGDVIDMGMRNDDVPNCLSLFWAEGQGDAAGVNRDAIIYYETCETLFQGGATGFVKRAVQELNLHWSVRKSSINSN
jgi:hypothetical protein